MNKFVNCGNESAHIALLRSCSDPHPLSIIIGRCFNHCMASFAVVMVYVFCQRGFHRPYIPRASITAVKRILQRPIKPLHNSMESSSQHHHLHNATIVTLATIVTIVTINKSYTLATSCCKFTRLLLP